MTVLSSAGSPDPGKTREKGPASVKLGPFIVRAAAAEVDAFRHEVLGTTGGAAVPFTFPIRWFTLPEIRAKAEELAGDPAYLPFHKSQSFDYRQPLEIDIDYHMRVEIIRVPEPPRLILRAEVCRAHDTDLCLRAEMMLRILHSDGEKVT